MELIKRNYAHYSEENQPYCAELYGLGFTIQDIHRRTGVSQEKLREWRKIYNWSVYFPAESVEKALARRITRLIEIDDKSENELVELARLTDMFGALIINMGKAHDYQQREPALNAQAERVTPHKTYKVNEDRPLKTRPAYKKNIKNDISEITPAMLDAVRERLFYGYQKLWWERKNDPLTQRTRFILKSRQIGATYYFAFEALDDAIRTGDNQIFLSASRAQAEVFKNYIVQFAREEFAVELKGGDFLLLSNGAELRFLSTNSATAQSYHGHLYIDEVFWIPNFEKINKVSSGMAAHKKWRKTYLSTPSAQGHQAYKIWNGEKYNSSLKVKDRKPFDLNHSLLKNGALGADGAWRHIVTIEDAVAQGCDLFDIEQLRSEYSKEEFDNLYMCLFIDDSASVFILDMLLNCMFEKKEWDDYKPASARPFGNKLIALGYDPSRTTDKATLAILDIPTSPGLPFRLLDLRACHGRNFDYQANRIKDIVDTHNVQHIGIDITGMGIGVYEQVEKFYPLATPIHYSLEMKNRLVVKALDLIGNRRFNFLDSHKQIVTSFLMIKQTISNSSGVITYSTERTVESGHADEAWAIMHAFAYEPLAGKREGTKVTFGH